MQRQPTIQTCKRMLLVYLLWINFPKLTWATYRRLFLYAVFWDGFTSNWLIWLSTFYIAATPCIEADYSPQERLLRQRKVSCVNQIIMLHSIHLLESFSLVHIGLLQHKKRHKERIRTMYLSNSAYIPRIFLGRMVLRFITEVLNLKYNSYGWIRTSDFHLMLLLWWPSSLWGT